VTTIRLSQPFLAAVSRTHTGDGGLLIAAIPFGAALLVVLMAMILGPVDPGFGVPPYP
jgi:hypothetical protein